MIAWEGSKPETQARREPELMSFSISQGRRHCQQEPGPWGNKALLVLCVRKEGTSPSAHVASAR
jgi:hypothetical protein